VKFFGRTGTSDPCGVGSGSTHPCLHALAGVPKLRITVADGPYRGAYLAIASGPSTWTGKISGQDYSIFVCATTGKAELRSGQHPVPATAVDINPFLATFPGALLGSKHPIVVTKA
jgi:hypothetical protein